MTEVSVVIPVRDDAEHLRRCLAALAQQTVPPLEVVVVDNASTDDSAGVALAHGARVVTELAVGIPAAAATGYDAALGSVIARLDADSLPAPDWVERIVDTFGRRPGTVAVTGTGVFRDAPPVLRQVLAVGYLGAYYVLGLAATGHHVLWGSSMAVRSEAWRRASGKVHREDPELHDDMDLALVLGPGAHVHLDPWLRVEVSVRSLVGVRQLRRRLFRAFRTLRLNWAEAPPWERWAVTLGRPAPTRTGTAYSDPRSTPEEG
ncbi:glycosyltransferase family 2 protein [Ornithinimicrobium sp. F0845]|uniref:glycosyltransferase family 2 protein n=1 Tax=Ornithinimicrobium sp. F0845 TaxID=2926412 RepID=UPI001FF463C8|nr:glycosyltransferase family 2 protein [Ornithinimicrobium sp. F0845]